MQTISEIQAELQQWYKARETATQGKTITISTSNGTRTLTRYDLKDIQWMIERLERKVGRAKNGPYTLINFNC